ncbi:hypothetical protein DH2020_027868 [Rehmannia glutinosa]|uniref:uridine/cytidine kinase n=1 Tax=Rehmannia glutinosa TaxID=99300 RepID=A0ABR0VWK4_REHGL
MDSERASALRDGEKNHFSPRSNGGSERTPLKLPFIIGVVGGTASGKTTVCNMIISQLQDQRVVLVNQDAFYRSLSNEQLQKVNEYNFDHPDAFDTELLLSCMETLRHGRTVSIPNYDFKTHKSIEPGRMVNPSDVIILEGILVLHDSRVRDLMNMKIFVDTDSDVRLSRRIQRDTVERGRNVENVLDQVSVILRITVRSGESMENALRACCKGIKIGKILIHGEGKNGRELIYEKLPSDIASRHVLLLDPVLASGNSINQN